MEMISYCIIFETNVFIEIIICMAIDFKSDIRQRKAEVFINFQGKNFWNNHSR